ncbi:MAG: hypothetical protein ACLFVZ_04030, partial [Actinomycetota bacterium]
YMGVGAGTQCHHPAVRPLHGEIGCGDRVIGGGFEDPKDMFGEIVRPLTVTLPERKAATSDALTLPGLVREVCRNVPPVDPPSGHTKA